MADKVIHQYILQSFSKDPNTTNKGSYKIPYVVQVLNKITIESIKRELSKKEKKCLISCIKDSTIDDKYINIVKDFYKEAICKYKEKDNLCPFFNVTQLLYSYFKKNKKDLYFGKRTLHWALFYTPEVCKSKASGNNIINTIYNIINEPPDILFKKFREIVEENDVSKAKKYPILDNEPFVNKFIYDYIVDNYESYKKNDINENDFTDKLIQKAKNYTFRESRKNITYNENVKYNDGDDDNNNDVSSGYNLFKDYDPFKEANNLVITRKAGSFSCVDSNSLDYEAVKKITNKKNQVKEFSQKNNLRNTSNLIPQNTPKIISNDRNITNAIVSDGKNYLDSNKCETLKRMDFVNEFIKENVSLEKGKTGKTDTLHIGNEIYTKIKCRSLYENWQKKKNEGNKRYIKSRFNKYRKVCEELKTMVDVEKLNDNDFEKWVKERCLSFLNGLIAENKGFKAAIALYVLLLKETSF